MYITGRRQERLDEALKDIGNGAIGIPGDVSDPAALDKLYAQIKKDHGRVDVVFANADVSESAPIGGVEEDHFDRLFNINIKGTVFTVRKALPLMSAGGIVSSIRRKQLCRRRRAARRRRFRGSLKLDRYLDRPGRSNHGSRDASKYSAWSSRLLPWL